MKENAKKETPKITKKFNSQDLLKKIWIDSKRKFEKSPHKNLKIWGKILEMKSKFFSLEDFFLMQVFCLLNDFLICNSVISFENKDRLQILEFHRKMISLMKNPQVSNISANSDSQNQELSNAINTTSNYYMNNILYDLYNIYKGSTKNSY